MKSGNSDVEVTNSYSSRSISAVSLYRGWRRTLRDYSASVGFWLLLSQLDAWENFVYSRQEHLPIALSTWAVICGAWYLTAGLVTPPIFYLIEAFPVRAANVWKRIPYYVAGYPVFAILFAFVRLVVHAPWMPETMTWGQRSAGALVHMIYEMFADELAIYVGIVLAGHAYFYFILSQAQERERLRMEQALTQSELQALKRQMQPHFLFNTLHGITTLVGSDPVRAQQMLLTLSGLLRRSMRQGDSDMVTLAEDLKFSEDYLAIEKMRLGARLTVMWQIQDETRSLLLPQLILQPLLENAIKHGIAPSRRSGWIEITSTTAGEKLKVTVRNSVQGLSIAGTGLSHDNIRSRLFHLFAEDVQLTFRCKDGLAEVVLEIPALQGRTSMPPEEQRKEPEQCVS